MVDKCVNHIVWVLNAIQEHNKILFLELKSKMNNSFFISNKNFQQYFYTFTLYLKLEKSFSKGYHLLLANKLTKKTLNTLCQTYLIRMAMHFKTSGTYLKMARKEVNAHFEEFSFIYSEMKNIASLLNTLESDINYLIKNLY